MSKDFREDNRGSALVMVIVVGAFLSIIASVMIFVSSMNLQTKKIDVGNTVSFYKGETVLEQLKGQLLADVASAYEDAYNDTIVEYAKFCEPGYRADDRKYLYRQRFVRNLRQIIEAREDAEHSLLSALRSMVPAEYAGALVSVDEMTVDETSGFVYIKGIKVQYTDTNQFVSMIQTDFCVEAPSFIGESTEVPFLDTVFYMNWEKQ